MIFRFLNRVGVRSDYAYLLAVASILGSIAVWAIRNEKSGANAERLGTFIGLWAPTFMIVGNGLKVEESRTDQQLQRPGPLDAAGEQAPVPVEAAAR